MRVISVEDILVDAISAEIKLTEIIHTLVNLDNAKKIQQLAKASASTEVIQFAEELLGCSVEAQIPNKVHDREIKQFITLIENLSKSFEQAYDKFYSNIDKYDLEENKAFLSDCRSSLSWIKNAISQCIRYERSLMKSSGDSAKNIHKLFVKWKQDEDVLSKQRDGFDLLSEFCSDIGSWASDYIDDEDSGVSQSEALSMLRWSISTLRSGISLLNGFNKRIERTHKK